MEKLHFVVKKNTIRPLDGSVSPAHDLVLVVVWYVETLTVLHIEKLELL